MHFRVNHKQKPTHSLSVGQAGWPGCLIGLESHYQLLRPRGKSMLFHFLVESLLIDFQFQVLNKFLQVLMILKIACCELSNLLDLLCFQIIFPLLVGKNALRISVNGLDTTKS